MESRSDGRRLGEGVEGSEETVDHSHGIGELSQEVLGRHIGSLG